MVCLHDKLYFSGSQIFYLVDESQHQNKGAKTVTSILHHHFQYHGYGETDVKLHIDNCSGQNKNNTVIGYLIALFTMCLIFNCNGTCNEIAIKSNHAQVVLVITGTCDVAYLVEK